MGRLLAGMGIGGIVIAVFGLVVLWPLIVIWALNTLFALGIAYTFWTWLAMLVLTMTFGKADVSTKKN